MDATESIAACFEIVDSRIENWKIGIVDTVADNASCGVFLLGEARVDPRRLDLAALEVRVYKNGEPLSRGLGSAVQGSRSPRSPGSRIPSAATASRSTLAR